MLPYPELITLPYLNPKEAVNTVLTIGGCEAFSISEWIFIPIKLISLYRGGQSLFIIFVPVIAILAIGLWVIRRKGWIARTPFEWAGILAVLLFFSSSVMFLFEMVLALTLVSLAPEIVITIVLGILPIILGFTLIRIISKNREKIDLGKRAFLFITGIMALFFWAGFLIGPFLAILASLIPQKFISSGN